MLRLLTIVATAAALAAPVPATADGEGSALDRYAADTWRSLAAMVDPTTGLPSDNINGALDPASRSKFTSPTNVGMYLWATVSARHLGLISADAARDRRGDAAIGEVELGGIDRRLVELHRAFVLQDDIGLVFGLLTGDGIQCDELLEAREVHLRLVKKTLVALQRADGLIERCLEGAGVDLRQQLVLLHVLAFLERHLDQIAADSLVRHDGDRGRRRDGAQLVQDHRHVAQRRLRHPDDLGRGGSRARLLRQFMPDDDGGQDQRRRRHDPAHAMAARRVGDLCVHSFIHGDAPPPGMGLRLGPCEIYQVQQLRVRTNARSIVLRAYPAGGRST